MGPLADSAYEQDIIAPVRVEHRFEYGDRRDNGNGEHLELGFLYNFIDYHFN